MEDILEVYTWPHNPKRPLVCMDETCKQIVSDVRPPLPTNYRRAKRVDYEYQREGVVNLFMFFEPLAGNRQVKITAQRTRKDWANAMRELSDIQDPQAEKIVVVLDNLNTHLPASFYEAFQPEEARRLVQRFEFHYTPKHGSWLNVAEIELSVLSRQCLDRRFPNEAALTAEVQAWVEDRNAQVVKVHWRFTTADARIKLRSLYPRIQV